MPGKKKRPFVSVIIVAAGSATRMDGVDKQLAEIGGMPVVIRSIMAFERSEMVNEVIVVTREESLPELHRQVRAFGCEKVKTIVTGGKNRQESVFCGVVYVDQECEYVAIHDGARPLVLTEAVEICLWDAFRHGAALLGAPVRDTIKVVGEGLLVEKTICRENLYIAQTPQVFELSLYCQAMRRARETGATYTDDCQLIEAVGHSVYVSRGHAANIKITTPDDLSYARMLLDQGVEEE